MTPAQLTNRLIGVPTGALLLIKDTDGDFGMRIFNSVKGEQLMCDWGVTDSRNYLSDASSSHCSTIAGIRILKR